MSFTPLKREQTGMAGLLSLKRSKLGPYGYGYSPFWKNFLASSTTFSSSWGGRGS